MRAIIPVAGFGSRLKPHTYTIPKSLLNVGGKPILGHIIEKLIEEKIDKATFVIGHLGEMIKEYVEVKYPKLKSDFVEQVEPKGLGHAIYTALPTFDDKEIFIILGDTIFDVDLKDVFKNKLSSLGVKKVNDPRRFGVAICENGRIKKLVEKPKESISNLALVGLYYIANSEKLTESLERLIKADIKTNNEYQLTDALQIMIENGEPTSVFNVEGWYDCGKPETVLSTNRFLLEKSKNKYHYNDVLILPPVFIAQNAKIEKSVIGPYTTISEGCVVSESIIKNSIISSHASVEKIIIENSIIGSNASIRGVIRRINAGDSSEMELY